MTLKNILNNNADIQPYFHDEALGGVKHLPTPDDFLWKNKKSI